MRRITLSFILGLCFIIQVKGTPLKAELDDTNPLWGVWLDRRDYGDYYQIFLPDGWWGLQYHEGIFYGSFFNDEDHIYIDGTIEYVDVAPWDQTWTYRLRGNRLTIWWEDGDEVGDYQKVAAFMPEHFSSCDDTLDNRLFLGAWGRVTFTDGTSTRLRAAPSTSSAVVANMPEGTWLFVLGEPACAEGYTWWQINTRDNQIGWVAEGADNVRFVEPIGGISDLALLDYYPIQDTNMQQDRETAQAIANALLSIAEQSPELYDIADTTLFVIEAATDGVGRGDIICTALGNAEYLEELAQPTSFEMNLVHAGDFICTWGEALYQLALGNPLGLVPILIEPDTYVDVWLDPINEAAWSYPLTCTFFPNASVCKRS